MIRSSFTPFPTAAPVKPDTTRYAIVVDDHPMVARGMQEFLKINLQLEDVYIADSAESCVALLNTHGAATLVVLDFWLPEQATVALITHIRQAWPQTAVLVVSGDDDPAVQVKVRASGAHGFLLKSEPPEMFRAAVKGVLGGVHWFYAMESAPAQPRNKYALTITSKELGLSARQGQVLLMVLEGLPNKRIAAELSLSESTVKEHVTGILQKLGVRNRVEAITQLRGRKLVIEPAAR